MRPYADRILLKMDKRPEKTESGLFIPDNAQPDDQIETGVVVEVSEYGMLMPSGEYRPVEVSKGDHVMARYFAGTEVIIDGEDYQVFREADIYAVIED